MKDFQDELVVKNLPANAGDIKDMGSIPGSRRSPRGGNSSSLAWRIPMDRGAWQVTVHEAAESDAAEATCNTTHTYTSV